MEALNKNKRNVSVPFKIFSDELCKVDRNMTVVHEGHPWPVDFLNYHVEFQFQI